MLYVGEGLRGSNDARSTLHRISVTASTTHNQTGPLWCWFPSGWACARPRPLWVSPMTSSVRLGVSPAPVPTPMGIFNQRFEALFTCAGARDAFPVLHHSESGPLGLSVQECEAAGSASGQTACSFRPTLRQSWSCHGHRSSLCPGAHLHPSYQSGCMGVFLFFFYLLGVGLPCRWVFCQFWLCEEAQCVYLRRRLGSQ